MRAGEGIRLFRTFFAIFFAHFLLRHVSSNFTKIYSAVKMEQIKTRVPEVLRDQKLIVELSQIWRKTLHKNKFWWCWADLFWGILIVHYFLVANSIYRKKNLTITITNGFSPKYQLQLPDESEKTKTRSTRVSFCRVYRWTELLKRRRASEETTTSKNYSYLNFFNLCMFINSQQNVRERKRQSVSQTSRFFLSFTPSRRIFDDNNHK